LPYFSTKGCSRHNSCHPLSLSLSLSLALAVAEEKDGRFLRMYCCQRPPNGLSASFH
jgi:hypothetical protein